jgi:hypothetical protein
VSTYIEKFFWIRYVTADRRDARERADASERKHEQTDRRSSAIDPPCT